jgi:hypothetical protein
LYRSIAITDFVLLRVRCYTASRCGCCVTAQRCVGLFLAVDWSCARPCVTAALQWESGVALRVCCRWRSLAVHVAHCNTCAVIVIVHVAIAVLHCCSVRASSDCCVCGVAALDAAACGRGRVCDAAPPLCVTTVLRCCWAPGVQCIGVCSCDAVCLDVCVYVAL